MVVVGEIILGAFLQALLGKLLEVKVKPVAVDLDDEIQSLTDTLLVISSIIDDAENRQDNHLIKLWLQRLCEESYNARDVLDEVDYEAQRRDHVIFANAIADDVFSLFISEEVDKVELLYSKFVSLVKSAPVIHTLLPLSPKGEVCDVNGVCVDATEDELFRLTTKEGKLTVSRETVRTPTRSFSPILQFEQDPVQILDALLPLYLNSQILRALQESLASELAARMTAMSSATDNATELKKDLSRVYNRQRQAKITGEILEIVAGADALT